MLNKIGLISLQCGVMMNCACRRAGLLGEAAELQVKSDKYGETCWSLGDFCHSPQTDDFRFLSLGFDRSSPLNAPTVSKRMEGAMVVCFLLNYCFPRCEKSW